METPRTVNELMNQAAQAARDGDLDRLERLQNECVDGWMQDDESRRAQTRMLDTFIMLTEIAEDY